MSPRESPRAGQVKRSFHRWLARAGASKQRKADEHARRERERLDLLRSSFVAWTDKLKEARLRDIVRPRALSRPSSTRVVERADLLCVPACLAFPAQETEVVNLHARNLLDNALFLWESRATLAMALHFDKVRRKRAALQRMRAELPRARERNRARKAERERVLREWGTLACSPPVPSQPQLTLALRLARRPPRQAKRSRSGCPRRAPKSHLALLRSSRFRAPDLLSPRCEVIADPRTLAPTRFEPFRRLKGISRARPRLSGSGFTDASRRVR